MNWLIHGLCSLGAPIITGCAIGSLLPVLFFTFELIVEEQGQKQAKLNGAKIWWSLTPQLLKRDFNTGGLIRTGEEVDFDPRHGHYMKCGEVVTTLASASLVFIPSLHFTSTLPWLGLPMVLLGFTVVYTLAFMGLLTYFYEMQLQNPNSFTVTRHCTVFSLGFSGLGCFAVAYFVLSIIIAIGVSHGIISSSAR